MGGPHPLTALHFEAAELAAGLGVDEGPLARLHLQVCVVGQALLRLLPAGGGSGGEGLQTCNPPSALRHPERGVQRGTSWRPSREEGGHLGGKGQKAQAHSSAHARFPMHARWPVHACALPPSHTHMYTRARTPVRTSPCTGTSAWPRCSTVGPPSPRTWDTRPCAQRQRVALEEGLPGRRGPPPPISKGRRTILLPIPGRQRPLSSAFSTAFSARVAGLGSPPGPPWKT